MKKVHLNFWQLWNMSFGCFGIQFGWSLQMANVSAIFEHLGANAHQLPILWLAAPLTGLLVQPVIGYMSDNTWGPLGRRRPYFLVGAILSSIALVLMPNVGALWMAAGLLWILDTSVNISMEPFRAFLGDLLPSDQRTQGFAMQSFFVGLGAVIASSLPWVLNHVFKVTITSSEHGIPLTVKLAFYIGAIVFLGTVLWTVASTKEYPPENMEAFRKQQESQVSLVGGVGELIEAIREMPPTMRQLAWVQCFTWLGMFCLFLYFPPAVAWNIFGATDESSFLYSEGIEWAGLCIAMYNVVCFVFAFVLPKIAQATSNKFTHTCSLVCGGISLISIWFIRDPYLLLLPMVGLGIAWASILAMPYAILIGVLPPNKFGIYTGIFNFFIVLPEVIASLGFGWVMVHLLNENRVLAVAIGGGCMLLAALCMQLVQDGSTFVLGVGDRRPRESNP
ncbi:MAG: MFS transporter [Xenococcaceae cyanobacterium]